MVTKLKLTLKTPVFGLAFKGLIFGACLYFYYLNPSLLRGAFLVGIAFWLYGQSLFNFSSFLPILVVLLSLALWIGWQANPPSFISLIILAFVFAIILGIRNLIITHRLAWYYFITCVLSYLLLLNFFLLDKSTLFVLKWLLILTLLTLLFWNPARPKVTLLIIILLMGEIIWLVNWLPIGPLSSANLAMLPLLFLLEATYYHRLSWKNLGLFIVLAAAIFSSSYWQL